MISLLLLQTSYRMSAKKFVNWPTFDANMDQSNGSPHF